MWNLIFVRWIVWRDRNSATWFKFSWKNQSLGGYAFEAVVPQMLWSSIKLWYLHDSNQFFFFFITLLKIIIIKGFWKVRTTTRDAIITFTQLIFTAHYYNCMYMMMIIAVAWCQKITNLHTPKNKGLRLLLSTLY